MYTGIILFILAFSMPLTYFLYDTLFIDGYIVNNLKMINDYRSLFKKHFKIYKFILKLYYYFIRFGIYFIFFIIIIPFLYLKLSTRNYFIIFWLISFSAVIISGINWICKYLIIYSVNKDLDKCKDFVSELINLIRRMAKNNDIKVPTCVSFIEYQFINHSLNDEEFEENYNEFSEFIKENSEKMNLQTDVMFLLDAIISYHYTAYTIKDKTIELIKYIDYYNKGNGGEI